MLRYLPYLLFLLPALLGAAVLSGQNAHRELLLGDKAYRNGMFEKAENSYRQATQAQPDAQSRYNLGNALYEQKKYTDAATEYEKAALQATDSDTRARALYNLGNAYYQQNQWDKAIDAYKKALRNSPGDADTRRNLALAQQESGRQSAGGSGQSQPETQNPEPETGQQSAEGSGQSKSDTRNAESEIRNQESGTGRQSAEGSGQSQPGTRNQKSEIRNPESGTAPPETDKLLQIMAREEQKVQQRLRRTGAAAPKSAKDW